MIYFKTIRWRNFLSTGNQFTEIDLSKPGTTLIVGSNGSGKSTMLCAITYALFGKPFRNINKPQLMNTITKKDLLVEIEFSIGRNLYMIRRGMKPNIFEVHCNDSLLNQSADVRDYQDILEKQILKLNYKTFCQVDILGSASFVPFMQLPTGQRRAVIEDLLDLQVFTTMNTLLKEDLQRNSAELLENEYEKKLIEQKIKLVNDHIKELKTKSTVFIDEKKATISEFKTRIEIEQQKLNVLQAQYHIIYAKLNQTDIKAINKKIEKYKQLKYDLNAKRNLLSNEITFFTDHENCPTCKQGIDTKLSCERIEINNGKIAELNSGLEKLSELETDLKTKLDIYNEEYSEFNKIREEKTQLEQVISQLQWKIDSLNEEIVNAKNDINTESELKISDLEKELSVVAGKYNELYEQKQVLAFASSMLKDGGIKTKIINQYVPIINKLINKYLSIMDFFVDFQLDSQFEETIKSRFRDEFSYSSFSEGEKQRIDLALLFTWRAVSKLRNSMNTNLLILDEVFDSSLDSNSTEMLMQILNVIGAECSLFVISHKEHLNEKFSNIIRFVKHKNFSKIEGQ